MICKNQPKVGDNIPPSKYFDLKWGLREPVDGVNCLKIYVKFFYRGVIAIENGRLEKTVDESN